VCVRQNFLVASDPAEALFLSETLLQGGYDVVPSDDPIKAVPLARRKAPDLVLVDLTLAGGTMRLSRLSLFPDTTAIPTPALADSQLLAGEAMRMGTRAVLNKPIVTPDLLAAVSDHVMSPGALTAAPPTLLAHPPRLHALRDLGVLDSPPEEIHDRFTRLVSHILDVPVALISLGDHAADPALPFVLPVHRDVPAAGADQRCDAASAGRPQPRGRRA
jgi:CheY-like chemotaxis protein